MKRIAWVLALAVATSAAFGQGTGSSKGSLPSGHPPVQSPPRQRMFRDGSAWTRMGGAGMLQMGEVQRELKLTDAQKKLVEQELRESNGASGSAREKAVLPILNAAQRARFGELKLQALGPSALGQPEIAPKLKLTAAQQKQATAILEKAKPPTTPITRENFEKVRSEARARREKADKSLIALLTPTQKALWTKLQGKAFAFPRISIRGMGTAR